MQEIIFKLSTDRMEIRKGDILNKIITLMEAAGWVDVSSKASSDFHVMHSKGINGNMDIYIQFRHWFGTAGTPSTNIDFVNGTGMAFSFRMLKSYTPGLTDTAGVFDRSTEPWIDACCFYNATAPEEVVTMTINISKDRIFCLFRPQQGVVSYKPMWFGIGLADASLYNSRIDSSRDLCCFGSVRAATTTNTGATVGQTFYLDSPAGFVPITAKTTIANYTNVILRNPDKNDKYVVTPMYSQSASYGIVTDLWGIMGIPAATAETLSDGDIVTVDNKTYEVCYNSAIVPVTNPNTSFYAVRIDTE